MLDLSRFDLDEIATALADQTDYERPAPSAGSITRRWRAARWPEPAGRGSTV